MIPYENEDGSMTELHFGRNVEAVFDDVILVSKQAKAFLHHSLLEVTMTALDRRTNRNIAHLRGACRKVIEDRIKNPRTDVKDFLSILRTSDLYKNNIDKMIDELLTIFLAGSKTVQTSTTNLLCYMNMPKHKAIKERLLAEIDSKLDPIADDL